MRRFDQFSTFRSVKREKSFVVDGDDHEFAGVGNRGDLPIDVWDRPAKSFEPRTLVTVPRGRRFIVRPDGKCCAHDVLHGCNVLAARHGAAGAGERHSVMIQASQPIIVNARFSARR